MSRCFSYPPPGYTLSGAGKDALIESIKLQKEKVKAEEQRKKEKKREKKERREEKKQKKENKKQKLDKSDIVQGHNVEKFWTDSKVDLFHKGSKAASDQLESSSLTEEHGKPVCFRVPSSSSDSTENSNKRKRHSSPVNVSRGHGNIIRIRLPSKKQNHSDASSNEQQPSTSGRTPFPCQTKDDVALRRRSQGCTSELASSNVTQGLVLSSDREQMCSTSKQIETVAMGRTPITSVADAVMTPMQKQEILYKNLIENWLPPQLQDACLGTEDLDWLLPRKKEGARSEEKRTCIDYRMSCSNTPSLWPRAEYLPKVDVYALPFSVPF